MRTSFNRSLFFLSLFIWLAFPHRVFAQVPGTMDNMIQAGLKTLSPNMVDPDIQQVVSPDTGASLEKTTIGEIDPDQIQGGALNTMSQAVAYVLGTQPISSKEYVADLWNNIGLPIPAAYAQTGVGFSALSATLPLWKAFRNVAYFLYVIIFMIIGLMIMFQTKVDHQIVITVQSALPKLIITLVLITFSYAIAGFLIDLIYIGIAIPAYLLTSAGIFEDAGRVINMLLNQSLFSILFPPGATNTFQTAPANAIESIVENLVGASTRSVLGWVTDHLARLIIGVILLVSLFKLFITLGIAFIRIIFNVILSPLLIMFNAFPGSTAFASWFKSVLSDIAMFPAVAILFMIAAALMGPAPGGDLDDNIWGVRQNIGYSQSGLESSGQWTPPFITLRGDGSSEGVITPIISLIGLFAIMMAPQVAQMVKEALQVKGPAFGSAIGSTASTATGITTLLPKKMWQQREATIAAQRQATYLGQAITNPEGRGH